MDLKDQVINNIIDLGRDLALKKKSIEWLVDSAAHNYSYNFTWLGRPIIQYPQDMAAMQEIIWKVKPDLIIETGIARGGSLIFSASQLAMLDICDAIESGVSSFDPSKSHRKVIGVDIEIRQHNLEAILAHPMASRIQMFEGSSIDPEIIEKVRTEANKYKKILVCLDSNHTHDHVLEELKNYASLVTPGSYCVVFDTVIEDMPDSLFENRPWGKGNNPKTAVWEFLKDSTNFSIDRCVQDKVQITVAPDGYLRRA
jgi:cephalosporin hydroxylase